MTLIMVVSLIPANVWADDGNVAEVNGTEYPTLAAAIRAAQEAGSATVTLLADVTESVEFNEDGATVTLDMNDHSLTAADGAATALKITAGTLTLNGNINITGGSAELLAGITHNNTFSPVTQPAVDVSGGILALSGDATISGGLLIRGNGRLKNNLTSGIFLTGPGKYSIGYLARSEDSINGASPNYYNNSANELLGVGNVLAAYNSNAANPVGEILKFNSDSYSKFNKRALVDTTIVPCTHPEISTVYEGGCLYCGYVCQHTEVDDDNKCTLCKAQMAVKVTHGDTVRHYNTGNKAFAEVADGSTVTLLADAELNQSIFWNADGSRADKSVTLLMNGKKLYRDLYETAFGISSGKLTIGDEAVISTNGDPKPSMVAAVVVNGGTLEFKARATIKGGLLVTDYDDDGTKIPGTLEGGLPENTIITRNGTGNAIGGTYYSVSVKDSTKYENVRQLLGNGYAYAVYNADGTHGDIVDGSVESIPEDVIVVGHSTHSFDRSTGKCVCGYECPHVSYTDGNCDVCGYECLHRDVNEETARCNTCNMNIAAKVVSGDTTTYYTNAGDAIKNAADESTVTLLASASLPAGVHVTNTKGITLDLNGKSLSGQALNVGDMDIRGNDIPGKLTVRDSGNGNGQIGLEVKNGGTLIFNPGNIFTTITQLNVYGGNIELRGGRIKNANTKVTLYNNIKMTGLLPTGYAYRYYLSERADEWLSYDNAQKNNIPYANVYDLVPMQCDHTGQTDSFSNANCPYCNSVLVATVTKDSRTTGYTDIQDAVNEANGGTVKLLANAERIGISSVLKLDCNGHAITKLTVSNGVTLASLLPDGYAFRQGDKWLNDSDLSGETFDNVTTAEAPVKSVTAVGDSSLTVPYGTAFKLSAKITWTGENNSNNIFKWTETTSDGRALASNVLTLTGYPDNSRNMDITISKDNKKYPAQIGTYTYWATFTKDDYSRSCKFTVTIMSKTISDDMIEAIADQTYDGNSQKPEVTVKDGETTLTKDTDYTVAYADNTKAGEATVTITGKGNYTGKAKKKFTIQPKDLVADDINVAVADGGTYDGNAKKPTVTVNDGDKTLTADTDYTLKYDNNINAGENTAKVTVTGKGNYAGTVEKTFSIAKADYTGKKGSNIYVYSDGGDAGNLSLGNYLAVGASYKGQATMTKAKLDEDEVDLLDGSIKWIDDTQINFSTNPCPAGYKATLTIPVDGGQNYKDYEVVFTITVAEKSPATVTISGLPKSIEYGDEFTLTATQDKEKTTQSKWTWEFDSETFNKLSEKSSNETSTITLKAINAIDVGSKITASYNGRDYKGSNSVTVDSIEKKTLNKADFEIPKSLTKVYDGTAKHTESVEISLKDSSKGRSSDSLTFYVYEDNIEYNSADVDKANKATLTVPELPQEVQNYKFAEDFKTIEVPASITAKSITIASATATERKYEKDNKDVNVDVTFGGLVSEETLIEGEDKDYTVAGTVADANAGNKEVKVTVKLRNSNYALEQTEKTTNVEIKKADAPKLSAAPVTQNWNDTAQKEITPEWSGIPEDAGNKAFTTTSQTLPNGISMGDYKMDTDTGKLYYTLTGATAEHIGEKIVLNVKLSMENYEDADVELVIELTKKASGGYTKKTEVATKDKVTTAPAEVKNETKTDEAGNKVTTATATVSVANQKEIIKQVKANKSEEIVINVSEKDIADGASLEINLDKEFIDSIVNDTDAKLTIKTPAGDMTFTREELKELSEASTGDTITIDPTDDDSDKAEKIAKAKEITAGLGLTARSDKTAKGNVNVVLKNSTKTKDSIRELKELGFTVKYRFYRSTKKSSGYKSTLTKDTASYTNTTGKKGTKYYYKVRVMVYDADGNLVAKSDLKQCRYASRTWSK